MKKLLFPAIGLLFLLACGGKATQNGISVPLTEADLFNFDKVTAHVAGLSDGDKSEAKQSFLKAIDEYRNKKSAEKALPLFTQSLLKAPDAKTYYEYGNALADIKDYPKAIEAYHMAERMDYSPLSKVLYNLACVYSLGKEEDNALKYLELAIQNGYTNGEHIMADPDMAFARESDRFKYVYETAMSGASSPEKALFDLYLSEYKEVSFPYTLGGEASQNLTFGEAIGYDYEDLVPDMRDTRFSRDVGSEFYFVARFPKTEAYVLTLYAERSYWMEKPPIDYFLCSYSPDGKLIDHMAVAGYPFFDTELKGLKLKNANAFEVEKYATTWEKNVEEFGYDENRIVKRELLGSTAYRIGADGKFREARPVLGLLSR